MSECYLRFGHLDCSLPPSFVPLLVCHMVGDKVKLADFLGSHGSPSSGRSRPAGPRLALIGLLTGLVGFWNGFILTSGLHISFSYRFKRFDRRGFKVFVGVDLGQALETKKDKKNSNPENAV